MYYGEPYTPEQAQQAGADFAKEILNSSPVPPSDAVDNIDLPEGYQKGLIGPRENFTPDELLAEEISRLKREWGDKPVFGEGRSFNELPFEEQKAKAMANIQSDIAEGRPLGRDIPLATHAQRAMGRLQGAIDGTYSYPPGAEGVNAMSNDRQLAEAYAQGETDKARILAQRQLGLTANTIFQAGSAASFGLGPYIAEKISPDKAKDFGANVAADNPYKAVSTGLGQLAGSFIPVASAAGFGARGSRVLGGVLARRLGITGAAKTVAGAASAATGGFAAGEAIGGVSAGAQSLGQGASLEEASKVAVDTALAYPKIARKIANGEPLDDTDRQNLLFLIPEVIGIGLDAAEATKIIRELNAGGPIPARSLKAIDSAIKNVDLDVDPDLVARAFSERGVPSPERTNVTDQAGTAPRENIVVEGSKIKTPAGDFAVERTAEGYKATSEGGEATVSAKSFGHLKSKLRREFGGAEPSPGARDAPYAPEQPAPKVNDMAKMETPIGRVRVEQMPDGTHRAVLYDKSGDIAEVRGKTAGEVWKKANKEFNVGKQAEAEMQAQTKAKQRASEGFTYKTTDKPNPRTELPAMREKMRAREYTPGRAVHTTNLGALESIAERGIQPTKDADGDMSVSGSMVNQQGKVTGGALSYGRSAQGGRGAIPVVLELKDGVKVTGGDVGDVFVRSEGKSYVKPEDIERVFVGDDPKPYTLEEAIYRLQENEGRAPAEKPRVRKPKETAPAREAESVAPPPREAVEPPSKKMERMFNDLGLLDTDSERALTLGNEKFPTLDRGETRIGVSGPLRLGKNRRGEVEYVGRYGGAGNNAVVHFAMTEESARGKGKASSALREITNKADELGMTLWLEAVPQKKTGKGLSKKQLVEWYGRHGFEIVDDPIMRRKPRSAPKKQSPPIRAKEGVVEGIGQRADEIVKSEKLPPFSKVDDALLNELVQRTKGRTDPFAKKIELQAKARGLATEPNKALSDTAAKTFREGDEKATQQFLRGLKDDQLETLRQEFKAKPRYGKQIRAEIARRAGGQEGVAGSPARKPNRRVVQKSDVAADLPKEFPDRFRHAQDNTKYALSIDKNLKGMAKAGGPEGGAAERQVMDFIGSGHVLGGRPDAILADPAIASKSPEFQRALANLLDRGDVRVVKVTPDVGGSTKGFLLPKEQAEGVIASTPASKIAAAAKEKIPEVQSSKVRRPKKARGERPAGAPAFPTKETGSVAPLPKKLPQQRARMKKHARSMVAESNPHAIIADLAARLGMGMPGIAKAAMLRTGYLGFYRVFPESIRLRMADDMQTFVHEVGHHLHKVIFQGGLTIKDMVATKTGSRRKTATGLDPAVFPKAWQKELRELGKELYGDKRPPGGYVSEGWAELIRYMFTDAETAKAKAPVAYEGAMKILLTNHPKIYKALADFEHRFNAYNQMPAALKVAGYIRRQNKRLPRDIRYQIARRYDDVRQFMFDRTQPTVTIMRDLGLKNVPEGENLHTRALRAGGLSSGSYNKAVNIGRFDFNNPGKIVGKPFKKILDAVKDDIWEFETYAVAQRALEKRAQRTKSGKPKHPGVLGDISTSELKQTINELQTEYPHFAKVWDDFQQFNRWLIEDFAVKAGLVTKDQAKAIIDQNLHYVTFNKVATYDQAKGRAFGRSGRRYVGTKSGIGHFAKFDGQQIEPPLQQFLVNMQSVMQNAEYNGVGQLMAKYFTDYEGMGRWIDKTDRPTEALTVRSREIQDALQKRLENAGIEGGVAEDAMQALANLTGDDDFVFWRPGMRVDKATRQFTVLIDGKLKFFEAKDAKLFEFLEGMTNPAKLPGWVRWLTLARQIKRGAVTQYNPSFFVPNFLRDTMQALVMTEVERKGGIIPGKLSSRLSGMKKAIAKGDMNSLYLSSGADMSGLFGEYWDPSKQQLDIDRIWGRLHSLKQKKRRGEWVKFIKEASGLPFAAIGEINNRFELATRMGEFEATLNQNAGRKAPEAYTRSELLNAGQAAADVTLDFQRGGTFSMAANRFIPFFNAAVQGADKLGRYIAKNPPRAFGQIVSYVVLPTIAEHVLNRNDEAYWEMPWEERDRYWHIPIPGGGEKVRWIKIPKPYGLGAFSIPVQRFMAQLDGIDPITGKRGDSAPYRELGNALFRDLRPPLDIPVVLPLIELMTNYSFYYNTQIVREGEKGLPVAEQGAERSSNLAYAIAGLLEGTDAEVAPAQIDYAMNALVGGISTDVFVPGIGAAIGAVNKDVRERPRSTRPFTDPTTLPILKRFLEAEPKHFTESMQRYWNTYSDLERVYKGFTRRRDYGGKDLEQYVKNHEAELAAFANLRPYKYTLDKVFKQIRRTYLDPGDMTHQEMQKRLDELYGQVNLLMDQAMEEYDQINAKEPKQ